MLPNHGRAIAEYVGDLLKGSSLLQEARRESVPEPVRMGLLYARLLEHRGKRPLRNSDNGSA